MLKHTKVKALTKSFLQHAFFVMFVTAVCLLFLFKLTWPKNKTS